MNSSSNDQCCTVHPSPIHTRRVWIGMLSNLNYFLKISIYPDEAPISRVCKLEIFWDLGKTIGVNIMRTINFVSSIS